MRSAEREHDVDDSNLGRTTGPRHGAARTVAASRRLRAKPRGGPSSMSDPTLRLDVLLVDDDPVVRKNYGAELRDAGFAVTVAADGDEALQIAWDRRFDVVLLDLRMPRRSGPEVLRALRTRPQSKETPVFLLAQSGDADLVDLAMKEGAQGVIEKGRATPRDVVHEIASRFAPKTDSAQSEAPTIVDAAVGVRARMAMTRAADVAARKTPVRVAATVVDAPTARRTPTPAPSPAAAAQREPSGGAAGTFSTMISRFVGESSQLAAAMGLPPDFSCTGCRGSLALRLAPDPSVKAGVRGRFYCPHCDGR
jgi:CheY-like chemotaxis protein